MFEKIKNLFKSKDPDKTKPRAILHPVSETSWGAKKYLCPVCGEEFIKGGIKTHISGIAKGEVYEQYLGNTDQTPHQDFLENHGEIKLSG